MAEVAISAECQHIISAKSHVPNDLDDKSIVNLSPSILSSVPFPCAILTEFNNLLSNTNPDKLICRVSEHTFVVQVQRHPLD